MTRIIRDPQLGPVLALVALRTGHPHLPPVGWTLTSEGHLSGTADAPKVFAAYAAVLGGTPMGPIAYQSPSAGSGLCDQLFATWQDVEFSLAGIYTTHPAAVAS
ncbi:hypothetical protein [Streptacidiphilus sp. PAMC 29251]